MRRQTANSQALYEDVMYELFKNIGVTVKNE